MGSWPGQGARGAESGAPSSISRRRPEILAPAGDEACLSAAVRAGADAVYFGLQGFNARARAANFDATTLAGHLDLLHAAGAKGYVTVNTLVFEHELPQVERAIAAIAEAGADAIIVQDLGVARLAARIAPELPIHASTQMTCTDPASVELARALGARRVVLARELSLDDIAAIRAATDAELEVFVHGALCVAYSGQCLTSEAIGGRSANRGACAQACRLPYGLVVDGVLEELGERAYLLSPEDLEASHLVPRLLELGVASLKIEGRLKGPEYVAAATRLYRAAVDAAWAEAAPELLELRTRALLTYSRGSGPGFLEGVDHQRLVEARSCDHRGILAGRVAEVRRARGRSLLQVRLEGPLARGAGIIVEGGLAGAGEVGGRVWTLEVSGRDVERAEAGDEALIWLGPDKALAPDLAGRRVFQNDDPALDRAILAELEKAPHREPLVMTLRGDLGAPFVLSAASARGLTAEVSGEAQVEAARSRPIDRATLEDKLGRLGETPFALERLDIELPEGVTLPLSALNRARRALTDALAAAGQRRRTPREGALEASLAAVRLEERTPPPPGLFVLCRNLAQAEAALDAGASGVYLDFLELAGTARAVAHLRARNAPFIGLAPPRIRKVGEEKIDRHLLGLDPDAVLIRGLGALWEGARELAPSRALRIGDFSLNVTNRLTAGEVLGHRLDAFTPSFDLDAEQLLQLLASGVGAFAELVIHHPIPLFHMEHCVFAALLSEGADWRTCGRPCERHQVALRDRAGMDHPLEADVGCRNTVFHAAPQSAAAQVAPASAHGVRRFRVELVRESPEETQRIVRTYQELLAGRTAPAEVFRGLRTEGGYGVVRGSLRVLST